MTKEEFIKIIEGAIETEVESYEFYKDAEELVQEEDLKDLFRELKEEELEHKRFLEDFLASGTTDIEIDPGHDYGISEDLEAPELSTDLGFAEAIKLAIKREEEAMLSYSSLSQGASDAKTKEVFQGLADMEQLHKTRLEDIFINVGYREVW